MRWSPFHCHNSHLQAHHNLQGQALQYAVKCAGIAVQRTCEINALAGDHPAPLGAPDGRTAHAQEWAALPGSPLPHDVCVVL